MAKEIRTFGYLKKTQFLFLNITILLESREKTSAKKFLKQILQMNAIGLSNLSEWREVEGCCYKLKGNTITIR